MNYFLLILSIVITLISYFSIATIVQFIINIVRFNKNKLEVIGTDALLIKVVILSILIGIYNYMICINF
jgi:hypothetical protein